MIRSTIKNFFFFFHTGLLVWRIEQGRHTKENSILPGNPIVALKSFIQAKKATP